MQQDNKRRRITPVSLVLTLVIYAVLGFLLSREKPESLPTEVALIVSLLPHTIAIVNAIALSSLILGYRAIKRGDINSHRRYMVVSVILIMAFLSMYVTRISLGGVKAFQGPEIIYLYIYLPLLTIHVALSIISVPLVIYNVFSGLTLPVNEVSLTKHPTVGRLAVAMWGVSLALGIVVYFMLNYIK